MHFKTDIVLWDNWRGGRLLCLAAVGRLSLLSPVFGRITPDRSPDHDTSYLPFFVGPCGFTVSTTWVRGFAWASRTVVNLPLPAFLPIFTSSAPVHGSTPGGTTRTMRDWAFLTRFSAGDHCDQ